jgi:large subunit ribosomal protein L24
LGDIVAAKKTRKVESEKVPTFLKKGDPVLVIAGGNKQKRAIKGQVAKIKAIVGDNGDRVVLEGLNLFVKHKRAQAPGQEGGKIQVEKSVHISNVMYYVETLKKPVRLKKSVLADGKRVRGYTDPSSKKFVQLEA